MEKKAKFLRAERSRYGTTLLYEYRGREYIINPELYTSTATQHRTEQASIDAAIEREERAAAYTASHAPRYEETAQAGFDLFWESVQ